MGKKYKIQYVNIFDSLLAQIYELLYGKPTPRLAGEAMQLLGSIGD
jgi:hypothetical protein